jgi:hypothetical protein
MLFIWIVVFILFFILLQHRETFYNPPVPFYKNIQGCVSDLSISFVCPSNMTLTGGRVQHGRWDNVACNTSMSVVPSYTVYSVSTTASKVSDVVPSASTTAQFSGYYTCDYSSVPPTQTYTQVPYQDNPGNTMSTISSNSVTNCESVCDALVGCRGFSYDGQSCVFKNNWGPPISSTSSIYYNDVPPVTGTRVDCVMSDWKYGSCVNNTNTMSRTVITQPAYGGTSCPVSSSNVSCADCVYSTWTDTSSCVNGSKTQEQTMTPGYGGGSMCASLTSYTGTLLTNGYYKYTFINNNINTSATYSIYFDKSYTMDVLVVGGGGGGSGGGGGKGSNTTDGGSGGSGAAALVIDNITIQKDDIIKLNVGGGGSSSNFHSTQASSGMLSSISFSNMVAIAHGGVGGISTDNPSYTTEGTISSTFKNTTSYLTYPLNSYGRGGHHGVRDAYHGYCITLRSSSCCFSGGGSGGGGGYNGKGANNDQGGNGTSINCTTVGGGGGGYANTTNNANGGSGGPGEIVLFLKPV